MIEAYENTHGGAKPAPALVKRLLTSTATDLGHPAYEQGAGLLNSLAAVKAAESWEDGNGPAKAVGNALVVDKTQLTAIAQPEQVGHADPHHHQRRHAVRDGQRVHPRTDARREDHHGFDAVWT